MSFLTLLLAINLFLIDSVKSQKVIAFPGADGAGKYSTGGRGGMVYTVSNLNDEGLGSLRFGVKLKIPRIIVFAVNGRIELKSPLEITTNDLTIAGQSAPGEGICLSGYGIIIKADNVIIRYLKIRPGDTFKSELDALSCMRQKDIIIDHCSLSWATDEVCSIYDNENSTLQWCIVSESLNQSFHSKGSHGYGGIWGGMNASFHHNLLAHHTSRNPRLQGSRYISTPQNEYAEIVNNVIFNWQYKCMYAGEGGRYYICNNYFKPGPATREHAKVKLLEPYAPYCYFRFAGNVLHGNSRISDKNEKGILLDQDSIQFYMKHSLRPVFSIKMENARNAYDAVLEHAGASKLRDKIDKRIIEDVRQGKITANSTGIINSQNDVGGWGISKNVSTSVDSDKDGMCDEWELKNGLNPKSNLDASIYSLCTKYTNIEFFLNSLVKK
ncbi:MAG: pectate lyase [Labilibaculum sp.]|nr:pectate lyase [Labilibaculum sp.]